MAETWIQPSKDLPAFRFRAGLAVRRGFQVDGIDVTDDTVGTTTINLSEESIQEFQVAQSTLDPANSISTSGAVNVITRSGSNQTHGSAFYLYRNNAMSAPIKTAAVRILIAAR